MWVRCASSAPFPCRLEETVTVYLPDERIEYTITSAVSPITDHLGVMRFESHDGGTRLHYTIVFRGIVPLLGPVVKTALEQGIRRGLKKLARMSL